MQRVREATEGVSERFWTHQDSDEWKVTNEVHGIEGAIHGHGLTARLVNGDSDASFGIEFTGMGRPGQQEHQTHAIDGAENRVEIHRQHGLREWYANGPHGLEHGFTIPTRPAGSGELVNLTLQVTGALRPVAVDEHSVVLVDSSGQVHATYGGLHVEDADGTPICSLLEVEDNQIHIRFYDADALYPVVVDPLLASRQTKLTPDVADPHSRFGHALGVSGDRVAVGAPYHGQAEGIVYIFHEEEGVWTQEAALQPPELEPNALFGWSVAILDDVVVIGAPSASGSSGRAHVYRRQDSSWTLEETLSPTMDSSAAFGWAVAIDASGVAITSRTGSGAVYFYRATHDSWALETVFAGNGGLFGHSVDLQAGYAAVGAPGDADGAVHVFERTDITWERGAVLRYTPETTSGPWLGYPHAPRPPAPSYLSFGHSVALSNSHLAVGAPGRLGHPGFAFVYSSPLRAGDYAEILPAALGSEGQAFGRAVDLAGDLVITGAAGERAQQGTKLFSRRGATGAASYNWSVFANLEPSPHAQDSRGQAVAIEGLRTVIGAPRGSGDGAVYVIDMEVVDGVHLLAPGGFSFTFRRNDVPFRWTPVAGASSYRLEVTDSDGAVHETTVDGSNACSAVTCSHTLDALLATGAAEFRVQPVLQPDNAVWSNSMAFRVLDWVPTVLSPRDTVSHIFDLVWTQTAGADYYIVFRTGRHHGRPTGFRVETTSCNGDTCSVAWPMETSYLPPGRTTVGVVAAFGSADGGYQAFGEGHLTLDIDVSDAPVILTPEPDGDGQLFTHVEWEPLAGVDEYTLWLRFWYPEDESFVTFDASECTDICRYAIDRKPGILEGTGSVLQGVQRIRVRGSAGRETSWRESKYTVIPGISGYGPEVLGPAGALQSPPRYQWRPLVHDVNRDVYEEMESFEIYVDVDGYHRIFNVDTTAACSDNLCQFDHPLDDPLPFGAAGFFGVRGKLKYPLDAYGRIHDYTWYSPPTHFSIAPLRPVVTGANLIFNGSFETPTIDTSHKYGWLGAPWDIPGWEFGGVDERWQLSRTSAGASLIAPHGDQYLLVSQETSTQPDPRTATTSLPLRNCSGCENMAWQQAEPVQLDPSLEYTFSLAVHLQPQPGQGMATGAIELQAFDPTTGTFVALARRELDDLPPVAAWQTVLIDMATAGAPRRLWGQPVRVHIENQGPTALALDDIKVTAMESN